MVSHTSFFGGAEQSLLELAAALLPNLELCPLLASPKGPLQREALERGIPVLDIRTPRLEGRSAAGMLLRAPRWFSVATALARQCRRQQDIRIVHANGIKAFIPAVVAARAVGLPCILHLRDYPRRLALTRFLVRRADAVVAASCFVADALGRETARLVTVIPNGVVPPRIPDADVTLALRRELGLTPSSRLVVMIAQQVPWKRHDLFLEAASRVAPLHPDTRFLVVGVNPWGTDSDYRARLLCRAAQPDLQGRVTFWEQRRDVGAILAAADLLVLPSDNEPFGRVVVEAAAMGVPAVVPDRGAPAAIVVDDITGVHFRHGNAEALAEAVSRALSDPGLRQRVRARAPEHAARFSVEAHAAAMADLYLSLLRDRSATAARVCRSATPVAPGRTERNHAP